MKINAKILSLPPYISTSWAHIRCVYMRDENLVVSLTDGAAISIPNLSSKDIEAIFKAHSAYGENLTKFQGSSAELNTFPFIQNLPTNPAIRFPNSPSSSEGVASMHFNLDSMESFTSALQHNSEQSHIPSFPKEILNKIAAIAKVVAPADIQQMPKPEPHCNCPHCQIARAIHAEAEEKLIPANADGDAEPFAKEEEMVNEQDLAFQQWEITQTGDKLYAVSNRLDPDEKYRVYLGHPVGCTCGTLGCEHILAVLKS